MINNYTTINIAFEQGEGILRLAPNWVPRSFCIPGKRIKLHPEDYYALGGIRGGIDERWLASTTPADNGAITGKNEGLSQVVYEDGTVSSQFLLKDAVEILQEKLIGKRIWDEYRAWPMYSKLFDNQGPLPFHIHHREEHARLTGKEGKPEAYYFPPQLNNHGGNYPFTFFGFNHGVTEEMVLDCLKNFSKGDNQITNLSHAHRLKVGTGWDVPPGLLHAPGSLCTYEPQKASDVYAMYQSLVDDNVIPEELLWKDTPQNEIGNLDYLIELIDWNLNVDPGFVESRFMDPVPVRPIEVMKDLGYYESWICYKSNAFSAKELTVQPGAEVIIKDEAAYGLIMMQGHGTLDKWDIETPSLIRFGQLTHDEYFVSEDAAKRGVAIKNDSKTDSIVMLKHFGPENPEWVKWYKNNT